MKKLIAGVLLAGALVPHTGFSATLQEQIGNVDSVISQQEAAEAKAKAAAEKKAAAQRAAVRAAKEKAKARNEAHEDKLRSIEVENMELDLQAKRARVKRTDEFLDQEIKAKAAEADVIQSEADATRNISSGIGENLKSKGRAEEAKAKK